MLASLVYRATWVHSRLPVSPSPSPSHHDPAMIFVNDKFRLDAFPFARALPAPSSLANLIQVTKTGGFPKKMVRLPKIQRHSAPTPLVRMHSRAWTIFRSTSNNSRSANPTTCTVQAEMLDEENSAW
ncbi:hypothetical protein FB45DRAFT_1029716 [Roridomyces roridus]|uniref:Uncharacterized protein n=1 Tax=Roridomyces roridus TaxID=1738132 RepID=A0AAD7BQH2_9AGAR|nr:hypothetical protein FB45DRAFT_1029716 [Roridomyces roridus]